MVENGYCDPSNISNPSSGHTYIITVVAYQLMMIFCRSLTQYIVLVALLIIGYPGGIRVAITGNGSLPLYCACDYKKNRGVILLIEMQPKGIVQKDNYYRQTQSS